MFISYIQRSIIYIYLYTHVRLNLLYHSCSVISFVCLMQSFCFTVAVLEEIRVPSVKEKEIEGEKGREKEKENVKDKLHLPLLLAVVYKVHIYNASFINTLSLSCNI